ncbi:MAG TPA: glycosyl transferase family 1 [Thermotogota bacterium]|nr:glycosyl transferase family 1 [Thermotogota bacterium]HPR95876.1 glycosyl transferase family 1 [Thermotogota bacterium]
MKIALAHFRVGETDGVSLEMEKWRHVFEQMGHEVIFISGTKDYGDYYIEELDLHSHRFKNWEYNSYNDFRDYENCEDFKDDILKTATVIEEKLDDIVLKENIKAIVPNNIFSLGTGLPCAIGFANEIVKRNLISINHNHDFYWERPHMSKPSCTFVRDTLDKYYPPIGDNFSQVVINRIAQADLLKRKNVDSTVVPNVFDFQAKEWVRDEFNADLREKLGIGENDIVFLQATRVAARKAIELGIETIGEIKKRKEQLYGTLYDGRPFGPEDKIFLFMPGLIETDDDYLNFLKKVARDEEVEIIWADRLFAAKRSEDPDTNEKKYSLWDAYVIADMITYPSILEGWGNQYLEGLFAKKPMIIFEYPVFKTDIMPYGFKNVSLGHTFRKRGEEEEFVQTDEGTIKNEIPNDYVEIDRNRIIKAAEESIDILKDPELYDSIVEKNFEIAREKLSYNALGRTLKKVIKKALDQ